jgi:hypothetical protein
MPVASDTAAGTHVYFGGNFSWNNVEPSICAGTPATDGEGLFFDTVQPYAQQMVIDNNISIFNGGNGIKVFNNSIGTPNAKIYIRHNTTYGNETGAVNGAICSEIGLQASLSSEVLENLSMTSASTGCNGTVSLYVLAVSSSDSTDNVHNNFGYSAVGNNTGLTGANNGFSYATTNVFGSNPSFANAVDPGAPSCGSVSSVPNCMATVVASFTPQSAMAALHGYQVPSSIQTYDPLFPQWLCNIQLPAGLVTMGCPAQSSLPAPPSITGVNVQ